LAGPSLATNSFQFNPYASLAVAQAAYAQQMMYARIMQQQLALQRQIAMQQQAKRQQKLEARRYRAEQSRAQLAERRRRTREMLALKSDRPATTSLVSY
jgi:hypothetical protein